MQIEVNRTAAYNINKLAATLSISQPELINKLLDTYAKTQNVKLKNPWAGVTSRPAGATTRFAKYKVGKKLRAMNEQRPMGGYTLEFNVPDEDVADFCNSAGVLAIQNLGKGRAKLSRHYSYRKDLTKVIITVKNKFGE